MTTRCSSCGSETRRGYENRAISLENAGVIRLLGVPYSICDGCSNKLYDSRVENRVEELLSSVNCLEGEKTYLWSGNSFIEVEPHRFQLPDYPDRYIRRPKRKVEI